MNNITKNIKIILPTLALGLLLGWWFFGGTQESGHEGHNHGDELVQEETTYTCSMHPQIQQPEFGLCPICAMDLVPLVTGADVDGADPNEIQMTESAMKLAEVQTAVVTTGVPEKSVHLLGKVKADERNIAQLTSRFGGRIEKLLVNYTGQRVEKGQQLGTIYSPELITAQKELLEAAKYKDSNPSFYNSSRIKLKLWNLSERQIDAIVTKGKPKLYFEIRSPIEGTVTKRHVSSGDYIKEGSALFEVVDLSNVWVMFDAYESDLPWISVNDSIHFTLESLPGRVFKEKVAYIDPFMDAKTRVAQIRIETANSKMLLKPEMFANGILSSNVAENTNELLIPKSSILWTGKRAVVYVRVPERETPSFLSREIVLGPEAGNFYVVADGLEEGETIAVNGVFKIDASAQLAGKVSMMNPAYSAADDPDLTHETFRVAGNCSMCKETIETAALEAMGIKHASWDQDTKVFEVSFNEAKISLNDVHKVIANAGYDTELETADDEVYSNLHGCCQYERGDFGDAEIGANLKSEEFMVYGNCGMCETRIEDATNALKGVQSADWDVDTKMLKVEFNEVSVELSGIHKAIAGVGHDTDLEKAEDAVYSELHSCCKYDRPE
jgi:membrane fusion protein, copper/silver efflux system